MPDWPISGDGQKFETLGATTVSTDGTIINSGAGFGIYGSPWVTIGTASIHAESFLYTAFQAAAATEYMIDIGIGATSGTVKTIVQKLYVNTAGATLRGGHTIHVPIGIRSGELIWIRFAANITGVNTVSHVITLIGTGFRPSRSLGTCVTYNVLGTVLDGTAADGIPTSAFVFDPGAVADVYSAWTAITTVASPSTTTLVRPISMAMFAFVQGTADATSTSARWTVDIGVGAGPTPIFESISVVVNSISDHVQQPFFGPVPLSLPAGASVSARVKINTAIGTTTYRRLGVIMYGIS